MGDTCVFRRAAKWDKGACYTRIMDGVFWIYRDGKCYQFAPQVGPEMLAPDTSHTQTTEQKMQNAKRKRPRFSSGRGAQNNISASQLSPIRVLARLHFSTSSFPSTTRRNRTTPIPDQSVFVSLSPSSRHLIQETPCPVLLSDLTHSLSPAYCFGPYTYRVE